MVINRVPPVSQMSGAFARAIGRPWAPRVGRYGDTVPSHPSPRVCVVQNAVEHVPGDGRGHPGNVRELFDYRGVKA